MRIRTHAARTLAALAALALMLVGCAGAGPSEPTGPVEVGMVDYAYQGLPDEVAAGTQFTVRNDSTTELHEMVAFRLPDDETRSVAELTQLPPEELQAVLGEPETVLLAAPGSDTTITAVGDGTLDEPGRYAVMCFIPTGADPQAYLDAAQNSEGPPDVPGGPPHFVQGMYDEMTVR